MFCKVVIFSAFLGSAVSAPQYVYDTPDSPDLLYLVPQDSRESHIDPSTLYQTPKNSEKLEVSTEPTSFYETPIESQTISTSHVDIQRVSSNAEPSPVPTSLYKSPINSEESEGPLVPSFLYDTPRDSSESKESSFITYYQTVSDSIEYESSSESQELSANYQVHTESDEKPSALYQLPLDSIEDEVMENKENDGYGKSFEMKEADIIDEEVQAEPEIFYQAPAGGEDTQDYVYSSENSSENAPYDFEWAISDTESGNRFSHSESRDGRTMQGQYSVLLPDGRTQVVTFYDDGSGYHADVTYER